MKSNPIISVLATKNNLAPLAAGNKVDSLAPGQIGIFNYETNLSVDATAIGKANKFYVAVGIDRNGDSTTEDFKYSAGQFLQKNKVEAYTVKCYAPAKEKIIDITNFDAKCDTEYGIKITVGSEQGRVYHGMTPVNKTFMVKTSCCSQIDCTSCPKGDCNELARKFYDAINSDTEKIFKAEFLDYTTTPGTPVIVAPSAVDAWILANTTTVSGVTTTKCLGIRLTSIASGIKKYCGIIADYYANRTIEMSVSLIEGFNCNGKVAIIQNNQVDEGLGADIRVMEYEEGGQIGQPGPYRLSETAGFPLKTFESFVDDNAKYTQVYLRYGNESTSGFQDFVSNLQLMIVIPCADNTTKAGLMTLLDKLTEGKFDALSDDAALCNCVGGGTPAVNQTIDTEGIG